MKSCAKKLMDSFQVILIKLLLTYRAKEKEKLHQKMQKEEKELLRNS